MGKRLTQQQKKQMMYAIQSDKQLYDKIINDMINRQIVLSQWDLQYLEWGFTEEDLKSYFDYNDRLQKYMNNQIYPKYKNEIDQLLFERQKKKDLENITTLRVLKSVMQLIQKYDVQDQQLLKQLYQIHKSNDDLTLLQKLVDRIEDNRVKQKFEQSKYYQPTLFAKKKFINVAKELFSQMNKSYKIAKDVYAVANYMSVVNKYVHEVSNKVLSATKDGNLIYNLIVKIKVNKNEIKNQLVKDYNCIFIEVYSPNIKNKEWKFGGINCSDKFNFRNIHKPQIDDGYATWLQENGNPMQPEIHLGVDNQDFETNWKNNYEDTLQHELIHVFQNHFGYKNKRLNYDSQNVQEYWDSFNRFDDDPQNDFNWKVQDYYGEDIQFTPYLANIISIFKRVFENGVQKEKIFQMLKNTDFNSSDDVKQLCNWFNELQGYLGSDSSIIWLYHIRRKDKQLFDYAYKKLINKILNF